MGAADNARPQDRHETWKRIVDRGASTYELIDRRSIRHRRSHRHGRYHDGDGGAVHFGLDRFDGGSAYSRSLRSRGRFVGRANCYAWPQPEWTCTRTTKMYIELVEGLVGQLPPLSSATAWWHSRLIPPCPIVEIDGRQRVRDIVTGDPRGFVKKGSALLACPVCRTVSMRLACAGSPPT